MPGPALEEGGGKGLKGLGDGRGAFSVWWADGLQAKCCPYQLSGLGQDLFSLWTSGPSSAKLSGFTVNMNESCAHIT